VAAAYAAAAFSFRSDKTTVSLFPDHYREDKTKTMRKYNARQRRNKDNEKMKRRFNTGLFGD